MNFPVRDANVATVLSNEEIGRRITAARILGGHANRVEFAKRLGIRNFGEGPVKAAENGLRHVERHELEAIAKLCDVPLAFFTVPRDRLGVAPDPQDAVADRVAEIQRQLDELRGSIAPDA